MYDRWNPLHSRFFAVADEEDFVPLRAPSVEQEQPAEVVELTRDEIRPGFRFVDGAWHYSAAWL